MNKQLGIRIKDSKVILSGSIEAEHDFDSTLEEIQIRTSSGANLKFIFDAKFDIWRLEHNLKLADTPKYYEIESSHEYGINDKIIFKYEVSTVWVNASGLRMYGDPTLSKDQTDQYNNILRYLTERGVIFVDEMRRDLKLLLTGHYNFPHEQRQQG